MNSCRIYCCPRVADWLACWHGGHGSRSIAQALARNARLINRLKPRQGSVIQSNRRHEPRLRPRFLSLTLHDPHDLHHISLSV